MRILLALLAAALLALPSTLAVPEQSFRYVAGTHQQYPAGVPLKGICSVTHDPRAPFTLAVGGVCTIPVVAGESVTVTAVDDVHGADVRFSLRFMLTYPVNGNVYENLRCAAPIEATGSVTAAVPEGCNAMDILVYLGATTGTLHVS